MAGKIRQMIDYILEQRALNDPMREKVIKAKLILKGINPQKYTADSADDQVVLDKLQKMLTELRIASAPAETSLLRDTTVMCNRAACSTKDTVAAIVQDIDGQMNNFDPKLLLYFASAKFNPDTLSEKLQENFPSSLVFGCSTAGEIVSGQMLNNSVVAMAFSGQSISDAKIEVVEDPGDANAINAAIDSFARYFKESPSAMDPQKYVGIVLVDGLCGAEEHLIETLGDLTNVIFIGGSAGDDLQFAATHVCAHGNSYSNGAVLVLLKPTTPFTFIKTQSFRNLGKTLQVTKADEKKREVLEFNGRPAAGVYAEALGTSVEQASERFMLNPVGLLVEGEPYVRSPQQIKGDHSMAFYCSVREGMELSLLESTNIIDDTRAAIEQARQELGSISTIINFNCILRTLELNQRGLAHEYGKLFASIPTIGFSTYGEQYIGHLNQTATMLVFK